MIEKKVVSIIKKFTSSLLESSLNQDEAEKRLNEIHAHFQQITKITGFDFEIEHLAAIPTAKGKALGLNHAAQCLIDYKRTVKFLKAIVAAIRAEQKAKSGVVINVFYAGCGPYAPFITLVAPHFKEGEVQFSLLEINKKSLDSAKKLINSLGLSNYIQEYYLADAVTFKVPKPEVFHILISETLDALLYRECYVPILFNLLTQFNKNIILIPENVLINLSLISCSKENQDYKEYEVGAILNVRESLTTFAGVRLAPSHLPDKEIDLNALNLSSYEKILLDTKVHIYNDIWLDRNESQLTVPLEIILKQPFLYNSIIFTYYLEPEIELKCKFQ